MCDYRVITGDEMKVQAVLNQWRHDYLLEIIPVGIIKENGKREITVVIKRKKRKES